ncbi:MAG: hypothetical protein WB949_04465, partial [Candidatus Acidiferrales bacterium]
SLAKEQIGGTKRTVGSRAENLISAKLARRPQTRKTNRFSAACEAINLARWFFAGLKARAFTTEPDRSYIFSCQRTFGSRRESGRYGSSLTRWQILECASTGRWFSVSASCTF